MEFTAIELFAGVAGFGLAIERSGGKILVQVEKDKNCLSVLQHHSPDIKRITDVKEANRFNLPDATLVCGGFPCTGMSLAGQRKGLDDEQSGLWWEFWRIIMELKPRYVLIENVPGLLSSNSGRDFAILLAGLTGILPEVPEKGWRNSGFGKGRSDAYNVAWCVLDSQFFGVPQRRRRVFIVGCLSSSGTSPVEILFEREGLSWHPSKSRKKGQKTSSTVNASAPNRRNGGSSPTKGAFVYDQANPEPMSADVFNRLAAVESQRSEVFGTLAASGAGSSRPAGNANESDLIVIQEYYGIKRSDEYAEASVDATLASRDYKSATDLVSIDLQQVTSKTNRTSPSEEAPPITPQSRTIVYEAIDVRNLRSGDDLSGTLQAKEKGGSYSLNYQNPIAFMAGQSEKSGSVADSEAVSPTLKGANSGTNQVPTLAFGFQASLSQSMNPDEITPALQANRQHAVFGISPDVTSDESVMPTLTQPSPSGGGHPPAISGNTGVRRLMPIETERLQSFPDNFTQFGTDGKEMSDSTRYKMMGNAITVVTVEWIIRRMIELDRRINGI